jgi:hypothetical protein
MMRALIFSRTTDARLAAKAHGVASPGQGKCVRPAGISQGTRTRREVDQRRCQDFGVHPATSYRVTEG